MINIREFFSKVFGFTSVNPRTYWLVIVALTLILLFSLATLFTSPAVQAKNNAELPASSDGIVHSVPLTTTTPTASLTPTSTVTPTQTLTATVTTTPTITTTPSPTPTPTQGNLASYLPAISNPNPTPTSTPTPLPLGFHGYVTLNGLPISGVFLELRFNNGAGWSTYTSTTTNGDGFYSILNVASLNPGEAYYIRYLNLDDPSRLAYWFTRLVDVYSLGSDLQFETFDIGNVYLINPASGSGVNLPFTFQWIARPFVPADNYEFDLFDPENTDTYFYTEPLGYANGYEVEDLPTGFETLWWYGWYVIVLPSNGDFLGGYGASYYYYFVYFTSQGQAISVEIPLSQSQKNWSQDYLISNLDRMVPQPGHSSENR